MKNPKFPRKTNLSMVPKEVDNQKIIQTNQFETLNYSL